MLFPRTILLVLITIFFITSCGPSEKPDDKVNDLADAYVEGFFAAYPEYAVMAGAPDRYPTRLGDNSVEARQQWQMKEDSLLEELLKVDQTTLEGSAAITYGFMRNRMEAFIAERVCRLELWTVSPTYNGWQNSLPFVFASLPLETEFQREQAFERLSQLPAYIRTETENLKAGAEQGYLAPVTGVESVIGQMDAILSSAPAQSPFASVAGSSDEVFQQKVYDFISNELNAAIADYRSYLTDEYLAMAREEVGVSNNPDGVACYDAATAQYISASFSAEEIHQQGLAQMQVIRTQMEEIGARSFGTTDPAEILRIVKEDPQYRFESREQMIEYAERAVKRSEEALPDYFGFIPDLATEVIPYPAYQEKTAPLGQAIPPTADGKQPGKYVINTYQPETQTRAMLESLSFHEAYPGHLFQVYVSLATETHPISNYSFISGFGEGWALYTERLADEMGLYSSDMDRVGWLASEAHRAARLVVDSGMHALGWTRQESIDYLTANTILTANMSAAETDRYIAVPGQATSYMMGALEIMRLRKEAEEALGEQFDIKIFHDITLEDGTVPLDMLRTKIEKWIAEQKG